MKKLIFCLCFCLWFGLGGFAQNKKAEKLLCRVWVPNKEVLKAQMAGKPEFERMMRDLENDDVFLCFMKDNTMFAGERGNMQSMTWKISPDGKEIKFSNNTIAVKELSAKTFVFSMERREGMALTFMPAPKELEKKILAKLKNIPPSPPMPKSDNKAEPAMPPVEEKKEE